jgi:DMSO reductase anchor subunit
MSPRRERLAVPPAEFTSYYGHPVVKPPTWKKPDVPLYLFLGGTAGASALLGVLADATGRPGLRRAGRLAAAVGSSAGAGLLVHDLGRPERFFNMLRVFKPTSPLSVGSWILAPFSGLTAAAAAAELTGRAPTAGRLAAAGSAVLGPAMTTYTAVLLADTAVPTWHESWRELPFVFAGSAMTSAAGAALILTPPAEAAPARRIAVAGLAMELAAATRAERAHGLVSEPYRQAPAKHWLNASRALGVAGALGAVLARNRLGAVLSGAALVASALCGRYGIFEAGLASTRDPRYTVAPQRDRLSGR